MEKLESYWLRHLYYSVSSVFNLQQVKIFRYFSLVNLKIINQQWFVNDRETFILYSLPELAVVVQNQIRLLTSNGTLIDTKDQPFSSLKALAYDNIREQFIVSDMLKNNDTVYTVQIDKHTTVPIIQGLPGDVQVRSFYVVSV